MNDNTPSLKERLVSPRNRIILSRIIAFGIILFCLNTTSYWEVHSQIFASLLFMVGVFLLAIGSFGRMWCSLYIAGYKNRSLIQSGPYSMTRNPLYFFSFIGFIGFGFLTKTLLLPALFAIVYVLYYRNVMKKEEKDLLGIFGEEYEAYRQSVPLFIPNLSLLNEPKTYTVNPITYRRHLLSAVWFVWLIGIYYLLQTLQTLGFFGHWFTLV